MKKGVIIAIVAAVVLIGGGVAAYYYTTNTNQESQQTPSQKSSAATNASLSELLEKGDPRKCTYDGTIKSGEYSGTAYFSSDKQMRNDYKSTVDGKTRNGSMIITNGTQYFWNTETKKGFKTAVQANDSQQDTSQQSESVDTKAKLNFHCESWTVDDSKFTPPSDVAIQDLTQIMQNIPTQGQ